LGPAHTGWHEGSESGDVIAKSGCGCSSVGNSHPFDKAKQARLELSGLFLIADYSAESAVRFRAAEVVLSDRLLKLLFVVFSGFG
jgi:hypothetical protein